MMKKQATPTTSSTSASCKSSPQSVNSQIKNSVFNKNLPNFAHEKNIYPVFKNNTNTVTFSTDSTEETNDDEFFYGLNFEQIFNEANKSVEQLLEHYKVDFSEDAN